MPVSCQVVQIESLSKNIQRVVLAPDQTVPFAAGQYLELLLPPLTECYFTIASAPQAKHLELHVQKTENTQPILDRLAQALEKQEVVAFEAPMGDCHLDKLPKEEGPLLLIAAGTGFSQAKAIAEDLLNQGTSRPVHVYWGARTVTGLYMADLPEQWSEDHENVHFSAVISEQNDWEGKQGLLYQAIVADIDDLSICQAVCCGSPNMVYATMDAMVDHGFRQDHMISDVFTIAPRDES